MSVDRQSVPTPQTPTWWSAVERVPLRLSWPEIDGVRTRVIEAGSEENPPLVLIHGTGGHAEAFIFNLGWLAQRHHVIGYDLPAHGWSAAPERSYEIGGYVQHLGALLDAFGIDEATVFGQSLGGWVAVRFVAEHGDRVERLVLVGPGGTLIDPVVMARIRENSMDAVRAPSERSVRHRTEMIMGHPSHVTDELVQCRLRIYSQEGAIARMQRVLCLQDPEIRARNLIRDEDLRAIVHPTLIVGGELDSVVPIAGLERWAAVMPNAELAVMSGCGHWPQFERPEEFNDLVTVFLGIGGAA